ncbi:MAG: valine--tRNA ligase [Candidatus Vogelbacteria bacterium]|nr:valine--tRNA ligase [Candidatus Vogelbacteria bacterium]
MSQIPDKLTKPYEPTSTEGRIYDIWEKSGYFNPDNLPGDRPEAFSIVLPPPNVTGVLHLGHAYENSLQDAIIRYQRMTGKKTVWIPGTDSAAIATQARVEKNIQKEEGKNRHDLGREELVKRVADFAKQSENTILSQVRKVGSSLDWSRYAYTMDQVRYNAVTTAFVNMYQAGLIYRGHRIVNWDTKGQTTISDDEIVYEEEKTKFYYLKYGPFVIGTARPETKFGDKYVVMHPKDERYQDYTHGQTIELEWINGPITATIIKDEAIDMEFGTGVMTITPWHSMVDFEIAERHQLDKEQIIDQYGKLLPIAGEFAGLKIKDAREKIVEKLASKNLVEKIEDYTHNISTAERTGGIIEPQIMEQWFIDVNKKFTLPHSEIPGIESGSETTLKTIMLTAVNSGAVDMPQEGFRKAYMHWIENLRDWCISRQIWFGHRIPVWYKGDEIYCGITPPTGGDWLQDEDVLDTWFSSALWTFSTLGWPNQTPDLKTFHPTSFMSPAYEILNLWVSRMILMSGFHLGQVPFKKVLIHGLLRDSKGQKFSKSLNNGIDPLDIIAKYGADALRMGLITGSSIGLDVRFDENKIKAYKHFANKIWNASRFVLENTNPIDLNNKPTLTDTDLAYLTQLETTITEITDDLNNYRLHLASEKLYHYFWHTFADEIIEDCKNKLKTGTEVEKMSAQYTLRYILITNLKLLHPFMPFITEEIWGMIEEAQGQLLIIEPWPSSNA